jgi:hypothetical protein
MRSRGGMVYVVESVFFIMFPGQARMLVSLLFVVYAVAEISFIVWLLIRAIRPPPAPSTEVE